MTEEKLDVLDGWLGGARAIAREEEAPLREVAERLVGAMTEEEREACWALYDEVEDLLRKVGHKACATAVADADPTDIQQAAPLVWIRVLATYDPERAALTTWVWREGQQAWRDYLRARSSASERLRRIERVLARLYARTRQEEGRAPTRKEKVEELKRKLRYARQVSRETLLRAIREAEQLRTSDQSLSTQISGSDSRTVQDLLPAPACGTIRLRELGRRIAEKTRRLELWEALLGEEPKARSLSRAEARAVYLEREARAASTEQIAAERSTSAFVVEQIEALYDLDITEEEVERYRKARGYDDPTSRRLSDEKVRELYRRYHEEEGSYAELAEDYEDVSPSMVGHVVRGDTYADVDRPDVDGTGAGAGGDKA